MRVIGYLTCGYPTIEQSIKTAGYYVEGGCDMLEISIPLENNREKPFLAQIMREAIAHCGDYDQYLKAIARIAEEHPETDITLLLYDEVVTLIGVEKFVGFCLSCGIKDVNSADLHNPDAIRAMNENGIRIAGLVNYGLDERRIEEAVTATGFIYCQAFPREGQQLKPGFETLDKVIPYLRARGVKNEIYCGGGISTPEDARKVMEAGADGLFLGTSIITLYDEPEKLKAAIRAYCTAVNS